MKPLGVVSTAVLFLLLGNPGSVCLAQDAQDAAKSQQQEEPKPGAQEERRVPQEQPKQQEEKRTQQEQPKQQEEKHAQHQEKSGSKAPMAAKRGATIPQDKFQAHFGRSHTFVINKPVIVEGQPRFQVAGFWFVIVDPWPVAWAYTDPCYIEFIGDTYYLFDPLYPGVQVTIFVVG